MWRLAGWLRPANDLRSWLVQNNIGYVVAVPRSQPLPAGGFASARRTWFVRTSPGRTAVDSAMIIGDSASRKADDLVRESTHTNPVWVTEGATPLRQTLRSPYRTGQATLESRRSPPHRRCKSPTGGEALRYR
ncbi:hypothetical protein H4W33_000571 [Kibdelosporangium phytohabitans]|nr:hypothetical protein [Kibdelosporangium phytohabitans]